MILTVSVTKWIYSVQMLHLVIFGKIEQKLGCSGKESDGTGTCQE